MKLVLGNISLPFPESFRGPLTDLSCKATSAEGPADLLEFTKYLRKEPTWMSRSPLIIGGKEVKVWGIAKLGVYKSAMELYWALKDARRPLSPYATELFRKWITVVDAPTTIKLVKVSLRQLGFEKPVALEEIFTHATQKYPLTLLPPETGACYSLQDEEDRSMPGYMAMRPIEDEGKELCYESRYEDDYHWLPLLSNEGALYYPDSRWTFGLRE